MSEESKPHIDPDTLSSEFRAVWEWLDPEGYDALRNLVEQFDALKLAATRQLTPLDVAATHIDILRRNSENYDAKGRDNVALIVEQHVNEARKALFDAISNPATSAETEP